MKIYSYLLILLILAGSASAECKQKECMTNEYNYQQDGETSHIFYYNNVFNIGTNWYIIFDYPSDKNNGTISFDFSTGLSKVYVYDSDKDTDSVSFPGSSFTEEIFNLELYVNITGSEGSEGDFILNIHVNKPPAEDLFHLWGGMTVFWIAIGSYVLFLSNKLKDLSKEMEKK